MTSPKRVLLLDSYDSFTFNIERLVEQVTGAHVVTIHNNAYNDKEFLSNILPLFDAVVVGPGPGHPANPADVGVIPTLWNCDADSMIPVFGVCLGMQSMGLALGAQVVRLQEAQHGQPGLVEHNGDSLFSDIPQKYSSIRYHSLQCVIADGAPDLQVLASCSNTFDPSSSSIMAIKHTQKPYYGVQYHPESICSEYGDILVRNFWNLAQDWWKNSPHRSRVENNQLLAQLCSHSVQPIPLGLSSSILESETVSSYYKEVGAQYVPAPVICEALDDDFILLNSAADPGRYSIIGVLQDNETPWIRYTCGTAQVRLQKWNSNDSKTIDLPNESSVWKFLSDYMAPRIAQYGGLQTELPFVGGLIGYLSYELGVESLGENVNSSLPDANLVDVQKCIVLDNQALTCYVVSLVDDDWLAGCVDTINSLSNKAMPDLHLTKAKSPSVSMPDENAYMAKIVECKEYLAAGDSYELCLTAQTSIKMNDDRYDNPWNLYKTLLTRNPAPYSCFMKFPDATLVGSSPERFMSWTRGGVCEFRPIKGTVKKVKGETTYESASAILNTPKERGENLMIVDLIRHDMHQLTSDVDVSSLMQVEEYKTVFQLVSVIRGNLGPKAKSHNSGYKYKGIDVLAHSLPPGSMTGAPKLRSVQILHKLEDKKPRGIYSGVCGFWSVTDQGDWSVVIRSAFSYNPREWNIGAGGAITILSDKHDEWDEMKTKLEAALQAFV